MRSLTKGLVAAALVAMAAPAMAAEWQGAQGAGEKTGTMETTGTYPGTLKGVNQKKNLVTIEVPLAPGAQILKDGKTVTLKALKKGDEVRAAFDPTTHEVTRLDVTSKAMMKGKTKTQPMQPKSY